MDNLKLLGIEHHGVIGSLRQVGQQFGMAGISVPGEMQRLFIQRRGSDGLDRALQRQRGRLPDAAKREIPCLGLDFARAQPLRVAEWFINDVDGRWGETRLAGWSIMRSSARGVIFSARIRRSVCAQPTTTTGAPLSAPSARDLIIISGPIPAGSPIVTAIILDTQFLLNKIHNM